jgi:superfamily II DNA/RNA helicase
VVEAIQFVKGGENSLISVNDVPTVSVPSVPSRWIQCVFLTSTYPLEIDDIANMVMCNPIRILQTAINNEAALEHFRHFYIPIENDCQKWDAFKSQLRYMTSGKCIVYCNTSNAVQQLGRYCMIELDIKVSMVFQDMDHDDKLQQIRQYQDSEIVVRFIFTCDKCLNLTILPFISIVIHCDLPMTVDYYPQRFHAPTRWGRRRSSIVLLSQSDVNQMNVIGERYCIPFESMPTDIADIF